MLIGSVVLYLAVTIAIELWAAQRVHNSKDYVVAGRSLPPHVGLVFSLFGMVVGSFLPRPLAHAQPHGRHH